MSLRLVFTTVVGKSSSIVGVLSAIFGALSATPARGARDGLKLSAGKRAGSWEMSLLLLFVL